MIPAFRMGVVAAAIQKGSSGPVTAPFSAVGLLCHFNGSNGDTTTVDSSSYSQSIVMHAGATLTSTDAFLGATSLRLDGVSGYAEIADDDAFNLTSSDFTIEFKVWVEAVANSQVIMVKALGSGYFMFNFLILASDNKFHARFCSASAGAFVVDLVPSSGSFPLSQWVAIAVTRKGSKFRLFFDGVIVATVTQLGDLWSTTETISIGNFNTSPSYPFFGKIDELRITKGYALYTANYTPSTTEFPDS